MYKKGVKLDEAGMRKEATEYYIDALARKRTNVDAKIALKKTGQQVLDDILVEFYQAQAVEDHKRAVYAYREADAFRDRVAFVGVELEIPGNYDRMYEDVKSIYVSELYQSANEQLEEEDYEAATAILDEIKDLSPAFKDVQQLSKMAFQEPLYRQGLELYEENKYREAYYIFASINQKGSYKDSRSLQEICQENGKYTVGLVEIKNSSGSNGADEALASAIAREVLNSNDPFLRLLDRSQTELLLKEQYLSMSGTVEASKAAMAGELLGAQALLTGEVIRADLQNGGTQRLTKYGFKANPVRVKDAKTGKTKTVYTYERVNYYEVRKQNQAVVSFQYRLVSTTTGEVLAADVITMEKSDETEYVEYSGDIRYLYPGSWGRTKVQDKVDRSYSRKSKLNSLADAPKNVRSAEALATDAYSDIANRVSRAILDKI